MLTGQRVTGVRAAAPGRPGVATTEGGDRLEFGHLALATGARPRLLTVPGADLAGVCYLRDVGHAIELRERLAAAQRVLVVGGGFIGLEAAAAATAMGKTVTVVGGRGPAHRARGRASHLRLLRRGTPAPRRARPARHGRVAIRRARGRHGRTGGTVTGAHLSDGGFVPADLVVIGIGAEPRTELAEQLGLACAGGIVVDAFARTSDPAIVAVGDCAVTPHPAAADAPWSASNRSGTRSTTPGSPRPRWPGCPRPTTRCRGSGPTRARSSCRSRGCPPGSTRRCCAATAARSGFPCSTTGGRLLAVHAVNSPRDYMAIRRALATGQEIPPRSPRTPTSRCARPAWCVARRLARTLVH